MPRRTGRAGSWRVRGRAFALLPLTLLAALVSCSPMRVLNSFVPTDTYRRIEGIPYGTSPRQMLDVYRPVPLRAGAPVVVFFYGGRWQSGNRESYVFVGEALAAQGFVAIIPDYGTYPPAVFPTFVEDGARAVRWAIDHAAEYGGKTKDLFLAGHSSGAHIVMLLGLDAHYLAQEGVDAKKLAGLIGMAGPYDFLPLTDSKLKQLFGPPENLAHTQPINFVGVHEPPVLLQYGNDDSVVMPGNSQRLEAKLREHGDEVEVVAYSGYGHFDIIARIASPLRGDAPILPDFVRFVNAHLAK